MKITIEIEGSELALLLDSLCRKEEPFIHEELHEDFDEDPQGPDIEPEPNPEPVPDSGLTGKKRRNSRMLCPVEVKVDGEWRRFDSMTEAAKFIGCFPSQVSSSVASGRECRGHKVRYAPDEPDDEDLPRGNGHE